MELVADIGATHARFQYCRDGVLLGQPLSLATPEYRDARALLEAAQSKLHSDQPTAVLLAAAGPMLAEGRIEITNTSLVLGQSECTAVLGCTTYLTNDFFALAHGVPYLAQVEQVGGGKPAMHTKAVLGPGTGLGMATLVLRDNGGDRQMTPPAWQVLPSEGGHADLAPGTHLELEIWYVLMKQHQHVCWETVLSGGGLQRLYAAMCTLWGMRAAVLSPGEIVSQGRDMADPVCHQTLETFCSLLGAVAGNLAVTVTARGGVYIGGGMILHMLDFIRSSPLRRRFEERGAMSDFVRDIPLLLITEPQAGLLGAARCLQGYRQS